MTIKDLMLIENEEEAKRVLILGISNQLQVFIINHQNSSPRLLNAGELDQIRSVIPKKIDITLSHSSSGRFNPLQRVCYLDLWISKTQYEKEFAKNIGAESDVVKNYITPQIEHMRWAIQEFWLNASLSHPPKKEAIVAALKARGATARVALAIDTIIRPIQYKKGGNRSR